MFTVALLETRAAPSAAPNAQQERALLIFGEKYRPDSAFNVSKNRNAEQKIKK